MRQKCFFSEEDCIRTFLLIMSSLCFSFQEIAHALLRSLVPLGSSLVSGGCEGLSSMTHLLSVMSSLASAGAGTGHVTLFRAAIQWVIQW